MHIGTQHNSQPNICLHIVTQQNDIQHNIQHDCIQQNEIQHNDNQHNIHQNDFQPNVTQHEGTQQMHSDPLCSSEELLYYDMFTYGIHLSVVVLGVAASFTRPNFQNAL